MEILKFFITIDNPWESELTCYESLYREMLEKKVQPLHFNFYSQEDGTEILKGWASLEVIEFLEDWLNKNEDLYKMSYSIKDKAHVEGKPEKFKGITINYLL